MARINLDFPLPASALTPEQLHRRRVEGSIVIGIVAVLVAVVGLYLSISDTRDGWRRNIHYVEDDRTQVCFAYQYNVGMFVLECERIPAALLEHKR